MKNVTWYKKSILVLLAFCFLLAGCDTFETKNYTTESDGGEVQLLYSEMPGISRSKNSVTITVPSDSTVYYSIDGTTPTTSSYKFVAGVTEINILSTYTDENKFVVKAISVKDGYRTSEIATASYSYDSSIKEESGTEEVTFTSSTDSTTLNNTDVLGIVATTVSSSATTVATAAITDGKIAITSVAKGSTTVTCKDGSSHTATIAVTVSETGAIALGSITKYVATTATYTVKYFQANTSGTYSETASETSQQTGAIGAIATYTEKTYEGFALDSTKTGTAPTIASDGSTVYNIYYARKTIKITLDANGGTLAGGVSTISGLYGATVTSPTDPTYTDNTFTSWNPEIPATFPSADMTCEAQWKTGSSSTTKYLKINVFTGSVDCGNFGGSDTQTVRPEKFKFEYAKSGWVVGITTKKSTTVDLDYYQLQLNFPNANGEWKPFADAATDTYVNATYNTEYSLLDLDAAVQTTYWKPSDDEIQNLISGTSQSNMYTSIAIKGKGVIITDVFVFGEAPSVLPTEKTLFEGTADQAKWDTSGAGQKFNYKSLYNWKENGTLTITTEASTKYTKEVAQLVICDTQSWNPLSQSSTDAELNAMITSNNATHNANVTGTNYLLTNYAQTTTWVPSSTLYASLLETGFGIKGCAFTLTKAQIEITPPTVYDSIEDLNLSGYK